MSLHRLVGMVLLLCGGLWVKAHAAEFRLSFLDSPAVLDDTCQLLGEAGFASNSVAEFRRLVVTHNAPGNRVDRSRFPLATAGYYQFRSFKDFTNRTACGFSETPGDGSLAQNTLMCFDIVALLLQGRGADAPEVETDFATKRFVTLTADGQVMPATWEQFRDATGVLYPASGYQTLVGRSRRMAEVRLGVSLRARRALPSGCTLSDRDLRRIHASQLRDWQRDGFEFPSGFQVGLAHVVNARRGYVWGDHAFLCFRRAGRYVCLEKNGPKGPFVRAEFRTEHDVAQYMSWDLLLDVGNRETTNAGAAVLVSLNGRLIGSFRPANRF